MHRNLSSPSSTQAQDYDCTLEWLPFNLSYVKLGGSTQEPSAGGSDVRQAADDNAERKARMYYSTARQYAHLQGLKIRGPAKLLDSTEGLKGMLFAKAQGREIDFLQHVYRSGWPVACAFGGRRRGGVPLFRLH